MKILGLIFIIAFSFITIYAQTTSTDAAKLSAEVVKLFQQKKYEEAFPAAQKVIEIREKETGKTHLSVAPAWRNLGYIQQQRGKLKESKQAFENALEIYEKNQPLSTGDEKNLLELLDLTAAFQASDGNFDKAEQRLKHAVELSEKLNGKNNLKTADFVFHLAQFYQLQRQYEKSSPLFLRALDIKTAELGSANSATQMIFSNATCALRKNGQDEELEKLAESYKSLSKNPTNDDIKTINGGEINGKAIELGRPTYPAEARQKRISGKVQIEVLVDEAGKVIFACAVSGAKELHSGGEAGAYNSKFHPTTLAGKPVQVKGILTYNFVP